MKIKLPFKKNYRISQLFGEPGKMYSDMGLKSHNGIDFACPTGTEILSCTDGVVEFVGEDSAAGKGIYIIGKIGDKMYRLIYWHLQSFKVNVGQSVASGEVIGISNNTGRSTGSHLHWGCKPVKFNGVYWEDENHENGMNGAIDGFNFLPEVDFGIYKLTTPFTKGVAVKKIQELLNLQGYILKEDGVYGHLTQLAVIHFQKKYHLTTDGIVGKATINKLLSLV